MIPPADDCWLFFLVAPAYCVTVLIHRLRWSVQLNILFTTNFMKHWDLLWSQPSRDTDPCTSTHTHANTHTHSPPGHIFTISQFMIIFSTVANQFWTPTHTNPLDKWIDTRTHCSDTYIHGLQKQTTIWHTHGPGSLLDGYDWGRRRRLYEWNNCLCAGSTDSVTSH